MQGSAPFEKVPLAWFVQIDCPKTTCLMLHCDCHPLAWMTPTCIFEQFVTPLVQATDGFHHHWVLMISAFGQ